MQTYKAPLRDMRFALRELHGLEAMRAIPRYADFDDALLDGVLEGAAEIAQDVLLPINANGDLEGCRLENGVVRTPAGFREAYTTFRDGGWPALASEPEHGGQGLPERINKLAEEMFCAANVAFSLYPGLTHGAVTALAAHGSEELKARFLPKLVDGTWSGTMNLTEPQCGTDLGMLTTKAVPQDDGSYRISGNKIFITAGDHDLTENIIHLVLARIQGAPAGVKGISMFLVPKFLPTEDNRPGPRNGVTCIALEHKMGIKGSATCQLTYENATGWLVGQENRGLQAMFTMMNAERVSVGVQGLGVAEAAYQGAVAYARERLQGRALGGAKFPELAADPIIVHPDIRRTLLTMRATTEGCRALGCWVAGALDDLHSEDAAVRAQAEDFTALMTPIVKALFTDMGFEAANHAVQILGGHGYIRDHGMEQYVRDARIAMIYEGANGIQALDLVGRKLPANTGRLLRSFFHPVSEFIESHRDHKQLAPLIKGLERGFGALQLATAHIAQKSLQDPEEAGAAATEYLRLFGLVALGFMWARSAEVALAKLPSANGDASFYKAKLTTARFFMERMLPQTASLFLAIKSGKAAMMDFEEAAF
jgi:alkylation response protein AidB-like acyl-CoA dehydrogenase